MYVSCDPACQSQLNVRTLAFEPNKALMSLSLPRPNQDKQDNHPGFILIACEKKLQQPPPLSRTATMSTPHPGRMQAFLSHLDCMREASGLTHASGSIEKHSASPKRLDMMVVS